MTLFDVNVLVYAHRADQAHHEFFRTRLEQTVAEASSFGLTPLVAGGFLRMVTHPRFPNGPTPLHQAISVIEGLAAEPHFHWVNPGSRHWELVAHLCRRTGCTGKGVADAQHAAVAVEHGCRWVSRDRDFRLFTSHGLQFEEWTP